MSVALSLVLISGCVTTKPEKEPWSQDKSLVIQSLQDAHVENAKLQEKMKVLDHRILDLERLSAEQQTKIVVLESAIQKNKVAVAKKRKPKKAKKAKALNDRLDALSAAASAKSMPNTPVANANIIVGKKAENADEKNAYTAAYLALKSGRYDEASSGFVKVIKAYPQGEYTDQAYYWLGESLVALLRNKEALESFTVVANQYPKSPKHAASLLKIASVYRLMKENDKAREALERVIKTYPDGRTAERARAELKALPPAQAGSGAKK